MLKFKAKTQSPAVATPVVEAPEADEEVKVKLFSPYADLIDEVGELAEKAAPILAEIAALQAKLAPLNEKRAALQAIINDVGLDDEEIKYEGALFRVEAGKRGNSRSIKDMALVKKLMGTDTFMKVATVKLGDIDKYLTLPEREQVLVTARTGRTMKIERKVA